ncbi:acyl carrier protein [Streptomyces sp. G5(2025)]|uniref:acyl carrier protein n=1 Tax=Streptomyces sp. G5(2025) TaxID=3406628 RepID=UPI003C27ED50
MTEVSQREQRSQVDEEIRWMLADATGVSRSRINELPAQPELFGSEISLSSLAGVTLLSTITDHLGVDIATEDLSLDCLESIDTLVDFVTRHRTTSREETVQRSPLDRSTRGTSPYA